MDARESAPVEVPVQLLIDELTGQISSLVRRNAMLRAQNSVLRAQLTQAQVGGDSDE
ncbi:MAG: hypothetical protein K2I40_01985 [Bifidobacterium castoris]|nr:hypothetical protein [Bifidobacterium castoris]